MNESNPSGGSRVGARGPWSWAVPALALLFTVFALVSGLGARFLCGVWFWAALWTVLAALAGMSCGGGTALGTGPPFAATSSLKRATSGSTGRPGQAATLTSVTWKRWLSMRVITAPSPDRRRRRFRLRALSFLSHRLSSGAAFFAVP